MEVNQFLEQNKNVLISSLTIDEFSFLIENIVESKLRDLNIALKDDLKSKYLTYDEAYKYLKISKPTFTKLRKIGEIKGHKVGERRVFFSISELDNYIEKNKKL